jgi:glyoxylase-like metal-dependent hydrolase (beta-lactamase superfamily II)
MDKMTNRMQPLQNPANSTDMNVQTLQLGDMKNLVNLIEDAVTRRIAVIDPAWDVQAILIAAGNAVISDILVSHWHDDHTNGINELVAATGAKVHLLQQEADFWNVKEDTPASLHTDGNTVQLGSLNIQLLHTPGHSPGSACFYTGDSLFTGDTLFFYGCGRCDLPGGDARAMYHSLQRLVTTLADSTTLYPGHDYADIRVSNLAEQKQFNPFLHHDNADAFIDFRNKHNNHRHPPYQPVRRGEPAW